MRTILLILTVALFSCNGGVPLFWEDWGVTPDPDEEPIELVVCEELITYSDTPFVMLELFFFNGMPDDVQWKFGNDNSSSQLVADSLPDLLEVLYPQFKYTYYESEQSATVFVDGTDDLELPWKFIWARDVIGQKAHVTAFQRGFYKYGSMTFEEAMFEASRRYNVRSFHFNEKNWTPEQYNAFARTVMHLDSCKHGEYRADFRKANGIAQSIVDSAALFKWEYVLQ